MGKITTAIVITLLVLSSAFGALCIFAGVHAYYNPSYHWVDRYYHGLYLPTLEKESPETAFTVIGVGSAFCGPSVTTLGAYIYSKTKEARKPSNIAAKIDPDKSKYKPEIDFILKKIQKEYGKYGDPDYILESRLNAKIASGKTGEEAILELYEEAKG
jgi:hypothetical protein